MARKRKPGSQSAGYHYDATPKNPAPTKTPTVAPPPSEAAKGPAGDYAGAKKDFEAAVTALPPAAQAVTEAATQKATAHREAQRAERQAATRQKRLVNQFVTKAYEHKVSTIKGATGPVWELGQQVEKAKNEVESLRERLLSHPAVKDANSEGKVVPPKGLSKLHERELQYHAISKPNVGTPITGPAVKKLTGLLKAPPQDPHVSHTLAKEAGIFPPDAQARTNPKAYKRSYNLALKKLAANENLGEPEDITHAIEAATLFAGAGGASARLAETGLKALPRLVAEEGVSQLASKGAVKAGGAIAGRGAATRAAVKEIPQVLKSSPQLAKAGLRAAPKATGEALRAAPKTVPKAIGRGAVRTGKTTFHAGAGLSILAATQRNGIDTPPGKIADAILKGTSAAVSKHPGETLETTARAIPSAVTAPAALLYATGQIPFEGTGPLEKTASMQYEGLKQIGGDVLSGDPKRVQKAVQAEGALAFLTPLPALTRSKAFKAVRTDVREAASGIRRLTGKGRQAPKGVEQSVFGLTDRKAARKRVALTHSRTTNPHRIAEARHEKAVLHGSARRPALEKVPEDWGHTISTLLEAGIRDPKGVKLMRERGPKTEPHAEGKINLDAALKIAEANPEMFQSKPFLRALRAGERASKTTPAALAGMGEVARYRTQGDIFGITPPDRAVPHAARKFTSAKDREGAWKQLDQMEARLTELRARARVKGPKGKAAPRRTAELKALEARTKGLRKALDPYTRPGQKTASGERKFWDERLEKEYIAKVQAKQKGSPLVEPAWTHHATFSTAKAGMEPGALPGKAGGKVYVRRGKLAENDLVDRSLQAFIRGTVQMPRRRAAGADFARQFVRQEKHPFTLNGKAQEIVPDSETWAKITGPKTKQNPDGGQFDPNTYARFPIREWKTAVEDPFTTEADLNGLLAEAEAGRVASHEPSVIVPRESIREFRSIANPEHSPVTEFANKLSRTSSRLILGTNPTWVIAQIPAEGIPLALAHPDLLLPSMRYPVPGGRSLRIAQELQKFRKENPEQAAVIEGAAGASPEITAGSLRSPLDLEKGGAFNPQPAMFAEAAKSLTRGKWGRAMVSTAKLEPLGLFDIKRQNAYRSVLLAAEADKQFRSWTSGVRGMFRTSAKLSEKFRGKSREELWTWLSTTKEGKAHLERLADYVDNVQGNWTAFSRYERAFAPLTIFYPFLRYSLRWTLWTFPRTHPLAATIAYTLGQVNSNELEKVLGAKPASPFQWAQPVVKHPFDQKKYEDGLAKGLSPSRARYLATVDTLPGGSRIAPGQSVIQQAVVGGKPSQLVGGLNPILGAGLTALGGPGPFGDKPSGPAGWAAVDQLLSLPAPVRLANIHSEKVAAMFGLARPKAKDVIAIAYEKLDRNKTMRQGLEPWQPQSGADAFLSNKLSRGLAEASANSKSKREEVAGDDSLTVQARQKKIKQMEARADKAKADIDSVLKGLGLDKENAEAYERYKAALYEGDKEAGGYSTKGYETGGYESSGYGGPKSSKALKYKPPGAGSISIPGLPLGGVGNLLGSLIGGEPAQAAVPEKAAQRRAQKKANARISSALDEWGVDSTKAAAIAKASKKYGVAPELLASIGKTESGNGTSTLPGVRSGQNFAGAAGPFQIGNGTGAAGDWWHENMPANADIYNYKDAVEGAAKYLAKSGATHDPATWRDAAYSYNHSTSYAEEVASNAEAASHLPWGQAGGNQDTLSAVGVKPKKPVPRKTMNRFQAGITAAKQLERAGLPYVWGGGHGDPASRPTGGGLDCSGAVSYVLNKMGALKGSLTSGDMGQVLRPGPGAVTVFYNPEHTFMRIGKKYFGTSSANPGGGAGFIPASVAGPEASSGSYNVGHVAGLGKKVAVALGVPIGSTGSAASTSFPGMTLANSGTTATINPGAAITQTKTGFSDEPIKQTPAERLKLVNEITSGNFSGLGIPGFEPSVGPSVADLQRLGASLEEDRRKLARL